MLSSHFSAIASNLCRIFLADIHFILSIYGLKFQCITSETVCWNEKLCSCKMCLITKYIHLIRTNFTASLPKKNRIIVTLHFPESGSCVHFAHIDHVTSRCESNRNVSVLSFFANSSFPSYILLHYTILYIIRLFYLYSIYEVWWWIWLRQHHPIRTFCT